MAKGHPNITAGHKTTFQLTKEKEVTTTGDCIVGVSADKGAFDISQRLKDHLFQGGKVHMEFILPQYGLKEHITGYGSKELSLTHHSDMVIRKSSYVCGRTLALNADKASAHFNREIAKLLSDPDTEINFIVSFNDKKI
ncbi:MAG: DUF371 domain-containing protein [Archaeoglobaceae archaeon]